VSGDKIPTNQSVLVVSDNRAILEALTGIINHDETLLREYHYDFACHPGNEELVGQKIGGFIISALDMKHQADGIGDEYDVVLSAHCKQIFPAALTRATRCINIHPGLNPYNRGWYPQVFSILNKLPLGATIHEIDEQLDHGGIIAQKEVSVDSSDTSLTAYTKVQQAEMELLKSHLHTILEGNYTTIQPSEEGNLNLKKDFNELRMLDLTRERTLAETLDLLRALTHPPYKNSYYIDPADGKKVWVSIVLEKET
jgi:methionyl-tRNA formyltransferase